MTVWVNCCFKSCFHVHDLKCDTYVLFLQTVSIYRGMILLVSVCNVINYHKSQTCSRVILLIYAKRIAKQLIDSPDKTLQTCNSNE